MLARGRRVAGWLAVTRGGLLGVGSTVRERAVGTSEVGGGSYPRGSGGRVGKILGCVEVCRV